MENSTRPLNEYLLRLDDLIRKGRELRGQLSADRSRVSIAIVRSWQQDCAVAVNELSGGSKAHWLARAFSDAFLVRSVADEAVPEAPIGEIVERLVGTLEQARGSLLRAADDPAAAAPAPVRPHRFDFVHNRALRPFLEQALVDAQTALEQERFGVSLMTTCGVLEAIITDALEHIGRNPQDWPFHARIEAAEEAGLIRGGCARLPSIARNYRDLLDAQEMPHSDLTVTARDARVASQVLQVVIRDLDPGR
jgi:hypothetical protein